MILSAILSVFLFLNPPLEKPEIISVKYNPKKVQITMYWKDSHGKIYGNIGNLKSDLERSHKQLLFAMNGGMYTTEMSPVGLYIENGKVIKSLNTKTIKSKKHKTVPNFYLQPNGVFYITSDQAAGICKSSDFPKLKNIKFATQSGPMLLIDGKINNVFSKDSESRNIRNGVGILPNNELIFAISKNEVSFFEFAKYFKDLGCRNALFLDGFVSKAYMPNLSIKQLDGNLGIFIGITKK